MDTSEDEEPSYRSIEVAAIISAHLTLVPLARGETSPNHSQSTP